MVNTSTSTEQQRFDLSTEEVMMYVLPLLTINIPVFFAFIYLGIIAFINIHNTRRGQNNVLDRLKESARDPDWQTNSVTRKDRTRSGSLIRKYETNTITTSETDELYSFVGEVLLTGPKPRYDLRQYRLDIVIWMSMLMYNLYHLQQQFPEVVTRLLNH